MHRGARRPPRSQRQLVAGGHDGHARLAGRHDSFGSTAGSQDGVQRGTLSHLFQQCVAAVEGSVIALAFCATVGSKRRLMDQEHQQHHRAAGPNPSLAAGSVHTQLTGRHEAYIPMQESLYLQGHGHGGGFDPRRDYHFRGEGADEHEKASRTNPLEGLPTRAIAYCLIATGVVVFVVVVALAVYFIIRAQEVTFDCEDDFEEWRSGWSSEKQAWCCKHHDQNHMACTGSHRTVETIHTHVIRTVVMPVLASTTTTTHTTTTTTKDPYDCKAPSTPSWAPEQIAWCCLHRDVNCPRTTTPIAFDCWASFEDWARSWSTAKQEWCCRHQRVACWSLEDLREPPSSKHSWNDEWDCRDNRTPDFIEWSIAKKAWCCEHRNIACPAVPQLTTTTRSAQPAAVIAPTTPMVLSFSASPVSLPASPLAPHP